MKQNYTMPDDLSGLSALLCVAEKLSFRAAASDLRVTPSSVSQTVRALEDRVGVRLLQRTTRSVSLPFHDVKTPSPRCRGRRIVQAETSLMKQPDDIP
jgi:hypothetical protein